MTQQEIEIFLALVEKRNLSKAASALYMSQSTLSYRLSMLENELNATLFIRRKGQRTLELTPYGYDFIHIAERWMALWSETQSLHTIHGSRTVYLGAVASLIQYLFPALLRRVAQEHREALCLMIRSMHSAALYPALENRQIDLGFSVMPSIYSNVINTPLLTEENVLLTSGSQGQAPGEFGPDVHPQELDPEREIMFHYHPDYRHWRNYWYGYFSTPAIGVGDAYMVEDYFAHGGEGWSAVPMSLALAIQSRCPVSLHRFTNPPPPRTCYLLTHRIPRSGYEDSIQLFQDCLRAFLSEEAAAGRLTLL